MTFIPTPDSAMARINFTFNDQTFSINPWFMKAEFSNADMGVLASVVDAEYYDGLRPQISNQVSYVNTTVYDMRTEFGEISVNSASAGLGAISAPPSMIANAVVLTLYTSARGKTGRGRLYVGGFARDNEVNGIWSSGIASLVELWYSSLRTAASAEGWTAVVVSKHFNGAPRTNGLPRTVTSSEVRSLIPGVQRRRLDRP